MRFHVKLCCLTLVTLAALSACGPEIPAETPRGPFKKVAESTDVAWLEEIANSLEKAQALGPRGGLAKHAKDLRTAAYARLGALGTRASLAACDRIEKKAKDCSLTPSTVSTRLWTHPCWHFGDWEVTPLAHAKGSDGTRYAVVRSGLLGGSDLFLISSKTPDNEASWTRPKLVPGVTCRRIREPSLSLREEQTLEFSYSQVALEPTDTVSGTPDRRKQAPPLEPQKCEIDIGQVLHDQDGDGWTDAEETRLGLDPENGDTDGDGVLDGMDCCPNFAPARDDRTTEEARIVQRAVFATFGLSGSRYLLIVGPKSPKVQVWGYQGPIIYVDNPDERREMLGHGAISVSWSVTRKRDKAEVEVGDYEGPLAAGSQTVYLKKIKGRWTVTRREVGWVS